MKEDNIKEYTDLKAIKDEVEKSQNIYLKNTIGQQLM